MFNLNQTQKTFLFSRKFSFWERMLFFEVSGDYHKDYIEMKMFGGNEEEKSNAFDRSLDWISDGRDVKSVKKLEEIRDDLQMKEQQAKRELEQKKERADLYEPGRLKRFPRLEHEVKMLGEMVAKVEGKIGSIETAIGKDQQSIQVLKWEVDKSVAVNSGEKTSKQVKKPQGVWSREAQNQIAAKIEQEKPTVYTVRKGETLGAIVKGMTGRLDYGMGVDYRSDKIAEGKKPKILNQANLIYPGQKVWVEEKGGEKIVVVADEREEKKVERDEDVVRPERTDWKGLKEKLEKGIEELGENVEINEENLEQVKGQVEALRGILDKYDWDGKANFEQKVKEYEAMIVDVEEGIARKKKEEEQASQKEKIKKGEVVLANVDKRIAEIRAVMDGTEVKILNLEPYGHEIEEMYKSIGEYADVLPASVATAQQNLTDLNRDLRTKIESIRSGKEKREAREKVKQKVIEVIGNVDLNQHPSLAQLEDLADSVTEALAFGLQESDFETDVWEKYQAILTRIDLLKEAKRKEEVKAGIESLLTDINQSSHYDSALKTRYLTLKGSVAAFEEGVEKNTLSAGLQKITEKLQGADVKQVKSIDGKLIVMQGVLDVFEEDKPLAFDLKKARAELWKIKPEFKKIYLEADLSAQETTLTGFEGKLTSIETKINKAKVGGMMESLKDLLTEPDENADQIWTTSEELRGIVEGLTLDDALQRECDVLLTKANEAIWHADGLKNANITLDNAQRDLNNTEFNRMLALEEQDLQGGQAKLEQAKTYMSACIDNISKLQWLTDTSVPRGFEDAWSVIKAKAQTHIDAFKKKTQKLEGVIRKLGVIEETKAMQTELSGLKSGFDNLPAFGINPKVSKVDARLLILRQSKERTLKIKQEFETAKSDFPNLVENIETGIVNADKLAKKMGLELSEISRLRQYVIKNADFKAELEQNGLSEMGEVLSGFLSLTGLEKMWQNLLVNKSLTGEVDSNGFAFSYTWAENLISGDGSSSTSETYWVSGERTSQEGDYTVQLEKFDQNPSAPFELTEDYLNKTAEKITTRYEGLTRHSTFWSIDKSKDGGTVLVAQLTPENATEKKFVKFRKNIEGNLVQKIEWKSLDVKLKEEDREVIKALGYVLPEEK